MPDPNLYFVLTYLIICEQLRRDILWDFIQGSELKATLSASCPGEIVSAKVIAFGFSSNSLGRFSEESLPYQTGKSLQCYCYCSSVKNIIGTCI